ILLPSAGRPRTLGPSRDAAPSAGSSMEELGYRVLTAQNGPEALSMLKGGEPIDLLSTDLVMPHGISGGELAQRARQMRPELKILLGSGYSARMSPTAAAAAAGLPIIGKPYRQAELAAKLRADLAGRRVSNEPGRMTGLD